ncbi:MAG: hypothetical protein NVS9B12_05890 [Vulcanimicrobiaceae bacterium]
MDITVRHWRFFAALTSATLFLQAGLCFFVRGPLGFDIALGGLTPFVTACANIRCAIDLREGDLPAWHVVRWALGRLWAVILIDTVFSLAFTSGAMLMFFPANDPANAVLGALTVALTSTMMFADVHASVEPQAHWVFTVPLSLMRSISLSWSNGNIFRVLALGAFVIAEFLVLFMLDEWFALHHVSGGTFLAQIPLSTAFAAPFAVLFTVVYFDCLARERAATS